MSDETDNPAQPEVEVTIRVPGHWMGPEDFSRGLPRGYTLGSDESSFWLELPDGARAPLDVLSADPEFFEIWREGCTRDPTETEVAGVRTYRYNVCLTLPGGSLDRAAAVLRHGRALIEAGGFGVFVDNSGLAHGACDWLDLSDDAGPDGGGPFWGFVNTYGDDDTLWTHGMQVMGQRDGQMPRTGHDKEDDFHLRNFLAYAYRSGAVLSDGDALGDDRGPSYKLHLVDDTRIKKGHAMHNPFGRYVLEPLPRPKENPN